jgi:hypothetical protein
VVPATPSAVKVNVYCAFSVGEMRGSCTVVAIEVAAEQLIDTGRPTTGGSLCNTHFVAFSALALRVTGPPEFETTVGLALKLTIEGGGGS